MGVKEKLIELLTTMIFARHGVDPAEAIADFLIDNGVTIQKWIPVSERLPTVEDAVDNHVYAFSKGTKTGGEWPWESIVNHPDWFTHWMPLPKPPIPEEYI